MVDGNDKRFSTLTLPGLAGEGWVGGGIIGPLWWLCRCILRDRQNIWAKYLHHERVPDFDLLLIGPTARFKAPFEDFLIAPTLQGAGRERIEIHFQKSTDPIIERPVSRDESPMVSLRQLALGIEDSSRETGRSMIGSVDF